MRGHFWAVGERFPGEEGGRVVCCVDFVACIRYLFFLSLFSLPLCNLFFIPSFWVLVIHFNSIPSYSIPLLSFSPKSQGTAYDMLLSCVYICVCQSLGGPCVVLYWTNRLKLVRSCFTFLAHCAMYILKGRTSRWGGFPPLGWVID